ncbi:MAG: hypothetical protein IPJ20_22005 [Flammeovirgaceae bacterium]|nr:hypothetical protein [Flammeovirgaceae bacterium]
MRFLVFYTLIVLFISCQIKIRNKTSVLNAANARLAADNADLLVTKDKLNEARMAIELSVIKLRNDSLLLIRQQNLWSQNIGTE